MKLFYCLDVSRSLGMRLVCISFARAGNTVKNANFPFLNNYKPNFILNVIFFPVINFNNNNNIYSCIYIHTNTMDSQS